LNSIAINYHFLDVAQPFAYHDGRRSQFIELYAQLLASDPGLGGRTLDVGCGQGPHRALDRIRDKVGVIDGVDPFPAIEPPAPLANRWTCCLEDIPVAPDTYDMAHSYNVAEHVEDPDRFLAKIVEIIKPGAAYWSMSPNSRHPFTFATRAVERLGLKRLYVSAINGRANDFPAYYRLSNDRTILKAIARLRLPISEVDFYYAPNVQWDTYFPRSLRSLPHLIDRALLLRFPKRSFIFMFRLRKRPA
jgi:SAM-dependent methyltransferase